MKVALDITFETARPLPQEVGLEMWALGCQFGAVGGRSTYRLQSRGEAENLADAVAGLVAQVAHVMGRAALDRGWPPAWSGAAVTSINAKVDAS